ncbi:MAG: RNA polymerase sigma factor [Planctomycetes bacterium]|nr:RNA polymerase sigma factor [Planctomycetota bacterium]
MTPEKWAMSGEEMMIRFQRGDEDAFEAIVLRYQGPAVSFAYRAIGDRARAEDLAQEAFIRVYNARRRYVPTASFTTWFFTIVNRLCMNEIRSRQREARAIRKPWERRAPAAPDSAIPWREDPAPDTPHEALEQEERIRVVREAILTLPPNQRYAVLLRRYEDLSCQEIARVLGLSLMAVKSLLVRARENLRRILEPYLQAGDRPRAAARGAPEAPRLSSN